MNQETSEKQDEIRWTGGLLAIFLVGLIIVTISVGIDARNRSSLETVTEPTAVGDEVQLTIDPRQNPKVEVLRWKGRPYFLESNEPSRLNEPNVLKLAKDDGGKINLYRQEKNGTTERVLVKIGSGEFLTLVPR